MDENFALWCVTLEELFDEVEEMIEEADACVNELAYMILREGVKE